ncbi:MAG: hypothetical protein L0Y62_07030 [Nitrospirae bacterium]|nr:hypothetical protein [Nitrospirota bacterium]
MSNARPAKPYITKDAVNAITPRTTVSPIRKKNVPIKRARVASLVFSISTTAETIPLIMPSANIAIRNMNPHSMRTCSARKKSLLPSDMKRRNENLAELSRIALATMPIAPLKANSHKNAVNIRLPMKHNRIIIAAAKYLFIISAEPFTTASKSLNLKISVRSSPNIIKITARGIKTITRKAAKLIIIVVK